MPSILVDETSLPPDTRIFYAAVHDLAPDHEIQFRILEAEWLPRAFEHVKVFVHDHESLLTATGGYFLRTLTDIFKSWASDRLKQAPANTEKLTVYGPDDRPVKTITIKRDSIEEK